MQLAHTKDWSKPTVTEILEAADGRGKLIENKEKEAARRAKVGIHTYIHADDVI